MPSTGDPEKGVTTSPAMLPYEEILPRLLNSIKLALGEFYDKNSPTGISSSVPDAHLSRHFLWLRKESSLNGKYSARHLFDGNASIRPLSAKKNGDAPRGPTRISAIIQSRVSHRTQRPYPKADQQRQRLPSILQIALEYLSVPALPASREYAVMSIKYFLFATYGCFPKNTAADYGLERFGSSEIENDLHRIETYTRTRSDSKGGDFIPAWKGSSAVTQHYLSLIGVLDWKFRNDGGLRDYLKSPSLIPSQQQMEFVKSANIVKMPDSQEIINGITGMPLPIRGADTIFRGGLRFPESGGLVMAVHGSAGAGKTALSLAVGASVAPFGIDTLFLSAEEDSKDLLARANGLLADDINRLRFVNDRKKNWLIIDDTHRDLNSAANLFRSAAERLNPTPNESPVSENSLPPICSAIVVLDGLHDRFTSADGKEPVASKSEIEQMRHFVETCRSMNALVIITTGIHTEARNALDYLVDTSIHLSQETETNSYARPERYFSLVKSRHQFCSIGTHGMQISGTKGLRFTPQANYQIDRRSIWKTLLHSKDKFKIPFAYRCIVSGDKLRESRNLPARAKKSYDRNVDFSDPELFRVFKDSNIFINGEGSANKAALSLKVALSPTYENNGDLSDLDQKILVVSFLYPDHYYREKMKELVRVDRIERGLDRARVLPELKVIHLYPGSINPDTLFNKIIWEIESAELMGSRYSTIIIDGIHNVFLQFPKIQEHGLFWPQLYNVLRTRELNIITTHTVLNLGLEGERDRFAAVDDHQSDPLRQALVQKTDFRFELDPMPEQKWKFKLLVLSAIDQPVPPNEDVLFWSREHLVFYKEPSSPTSPNKRLAPNKSTK